MNTAEDEQTRERRERAEQDARRKAVASEYDADQARARERMEAAARVEPDPLVGTWRRWPGKVARIARVMPETVDGHHRLFYLHVPHDLLSPYGARAPFDYLREATTPASPRDALDAKLATLTPEQRARVTLEECGRTFAPGHVCVDGRRVACLIDDTIDVMLAALDAALSAPAPQLTRTEAVECASMRCTKARVGIGPFCYDCARGVSALAVTPARAMEAATTVFDGKVFVYEPNRIERARKSVEELVVPGMTTIVDLALDEFAEAVAEAVRVMAVDDGSRLRRNHSLTLDAVTQLRRVHAELGRLIETTDVLLKEGA